jgi:hypothetical protein
VNAKVTGVCSTHGRLHWEQDVGAQVHNVWAPADWVTWISRDESTWRDPYDKAEDPTAPAGASPGATPSIGAGR